MYHYEDYKQYMKDTLGTDYPVIRASEHGHIFRTDAVLRVVFVRKSYTKAELPVPD